MIIVSSKSRFWMEIGWIGVISLFVSDGLKGISCILFFDFRYQMRSFHRHRCSYVWAFLFSMWFVHYLCYLELFFTSLIILSNFSFNSFLSSAISLFVLAVTLCVHTCISFSFNVGSIKTVSLPLTELTLSKLLLNHSLITLRCLCF